jgi:HlyD family secretion protein
MRRAIIWVLVLLVVAGGVGALIWWRQNQAARPVGDILRTGQAFRGDLQLTVPASGNVLVNEHTDLALLAPGYIAEVNVTQNSRVKRGDVLARVDASTMERNIQQAEIALAQAELALETAQRETDPEDVRLAKLALTNAAQALEVARIGGETARVDSDALLVQAQRQREQAFRLYRDAIGGDDETPLRTAYEDAEAEERIARINARVMTEQAESQQQTALARYQQAQRNLERLQEEPNTEQIRQRRLQVEQAQLRLEQAQRMLEDSTLTTPYDGVIANVYIEAGTEQRAGTRAFTLIDDSAYYVDITIDEIDIGAIRVGQRGEVTLDAYPRETLSGTVERISPAATNLGGLVAYSVRLRVDPVEDVRLLQGLTASVNIQTELVEDVLLIPNWAVRIDQAAAQAYAYRLVNGVPERVTLEIGRRSDNYTEILSGLSDGDEIALVTEQRSLPMFGGGPFGRNAGQQ